MAKWRKGDLARFKITRATAPSFEVLGATPDKSAVRIIYDKKSTPETIPFATFAKDCVNWWELRGPVPKLLPWIREGATFQFKTASRVVEVPPNVPSPRAVPTFVPGHYAVWSDNVVVSKITASIIPTDTDFKIRSIRYDYASCETADGKVHLLPTNDIIQWGFQRLTAWDRLDKDDIL